MSLHDTLTAHAREKGSIRHYRVVVLEGDDRVTVRDFEALAEAKGHADDAAAEAAERPALAIVLDETFRVVHEGRAYWSG